MLFSEPKIPQSRSTRRRAASLTVSVLFSEPKIPQSSNHVPCAVTDTVSVLFSEPKIPQCVPSARRGAHPSRFSALQRAENSSIEHKAERRIDTSTFQCSSASRKFLNQSRRFRNCAEVKFQCSSASRKFLNCIDYAHILPHPARFSALQRAENSSIEAKSLKKDEAERFSALQRAENSSIPRGRGRDHPLTGFSALQRAENSSITRRIRRGAALRVFQCSSASRKFLNRTRSSPSAPTAPVSVLFSEPKIPQSLEQRTIVLPESDVSVLFSEPKIPQSGSATAVAW